MEEKADDLRAARHECKLNEKVDAGVSTSVLSLLNNAIPIAPHYRLTRYSAIDNERHDADHKTVNVMSLFIPKSSAKRKIPRLR